MENNSDNKYIRAKERVAELRKFYGNLTSYVIVITGLAVLNYWVNEWRYTWFLWVALGWGIGIVAHAFATFNLNPFFGRDWEKRKIKEFMDKENSESKWQ